MPNSFGEPVPDATGELRLQLMQAQDQREAFRALGHRDVLAVIREALATDLSETCDKLRAEITRMEGENHRLKAEVERLTIAADWKTPARKIKALEAEVQRLEQSKAYIMEVADRTSTTIATQRDLLKAEVERLRKAGDELRDSLPYIVDERLDDKTMRKIMNRWNAAKEGKQP